MSPIGVMHLIDTLEVGGAEQMAMSLANLLPRDQFEPHLCTTRHEGPLAAAVGPDVGRLRLARVRRFDAGALARLVRYVRRHDIQLLHAHSTAVFTAAAASVFAPWPAVVWHDHFGRDIGQRRPWPYRPLASRIAGVIAVSSLLADWASAALGVPAERIRYIPNFVVPPSGGTAVPTLPGVPGFRIVCVANWREQKDHATLLEAFALVMRRAPAAHLLLVGTESQDAYGERIRQDISRLGLQAHVTRLGYRPDVAALLTGADIGVLSSRSEGLPLALLDYGRAGLAVVATSVGQCAEVLDHGRAGALVKPGSPDDLASAIVGLLEHAEGRASAARAFQARVASVYSPERAVHQVCQLYQVVLARRARGGKTPAPPPHSGAASAGMIRRATS